MNDSLRAAVTRAAEKWYAASPFPKSSKEWKDLVKNLADTFLSELSSDDGWIPVEREKPAINEPVWIGDCVNGVSSEGWWDGKYWQSRRLWGREFQPTHWMHKQAVPEPPRRRRHDQAIF